MKKHHPKDWLLSVEIFELANGKDEKLASEVLEHLEECKNSEDPKWHILIDNGMNLVKPDLVKDNYSFSSAFLLVSPNLHHCI